MADKQSNGEEITMRLNNVLPQLIIYFNANFLMISFILINFWYKSLHVT